MMRAAEGNGYLKVLEFYPGITHNMLGNYYRTHNVHCLLRSTTYMHYDFCALYYMFCNVLHAQLLLCKYFDVLYLLCIVYKTYYLLSLV